jgi:hypothetical protein
MIPFNANQIFFFLYRYELFSYASLLHVETTFKILVQPFISLINQFNLSYCFNSCITSVSSIFLLEVQYHIISLFFSFISFSYCQLVLFVLLGMKENCLTKDHVLILLSSFLLWHVMNGC